MNAPYKAVIVGAGRIGLGGGGFKYSHADAYLALPDRVKLVAVVDPDILRQHEALDKLKVDIAYASITECLEREKPNVVSICTPPEVRQEVLVPLLSCPSIKAVWCEKPCGAARQVDRLGMHSVPWPWPVQVNYIRRFDRNHISYMKNPIGSPKQDVIIPYVEFITGGTVEDFTMELFVFAKKDIHTVCHFTDLARMWDVRPDNLRYYGYDGPNSYVLRMRHRDGIERDIFFPLGGIPNPQECMNAALTNLLDALEDKAELRSPPENAIESEKWAEEILKMETTV